MGFIATMTKNSFPWLCTRTSAEKRIPPAFSGAPARSLHASLLCRPRPPTPSATSPPIEAPSAELPPLCPTTSIQLGRLLSRATKPRPTPNRGTDSHNHVVVVAALKRRAYEAHTVFASARPAQATSASTVASQTAHRSRLCLSSSLRQ